MKYKYMINQLLKSELSNRQIILQLKKNKELSNLLCKETSFLETDNIIERLYYIKHNLHEVIKCPYCNNKAKWSGRLNDGYKITCCSKECESKRISAQKHGQTNISNNRDNEFIDKQSKVILVTDNIIKGLVKYDKWVPLIDNERILSYLNNRFNDSFSILETVQRIRLGKTGNKPLCPTCGKPVVWIGKKTKLYTTYCCNSCAANNKNTQQKKKNTTLKNWGTENCYDSEKYKSLMQSKYGVDYMSQRDDVKQKRKETLIKHYGTTKLFSVEEIKNKIISTNIEKYGYESIFQSPEFRKYSIEKQKENNVQGTSKMEDVIYSYFLEIGLNPERFHHDDIFPYTVDFYLENYDLYIEYQGSQYHNNTAFLNTKEQKIQLQSLKQKADNYEKANNKKSQYSSIIYTWCELDVKKRNTAKKLNLNYLEIYSCKNVDDLKFQLGFYLTCKYNHQLYSFNEKQLNNEFLYYKNLNCKSCLEGISRKNLIIKNFSGNLFFKKEMNLFANDPIIRRKIIQNRCKYLNKKEYELNIDDIISGFKKSGIYYGYSHFNPQWTNWFIHKYNIKTIYDPCGGWGHHLLGMLSCDKIIYNDLSKNTYQSVCNIKSYFSINQLQCLNNDATTYIPDNVDAFFMCPPYYNLEHYECGDFEDFETYKIFLNKIFDIWRKNTAHIFGVILREDFALFINYEYSEKIEIPVSTSHLVKSKKYKEYFYIYKK